MKSADASLHLIAQRRELLPAAALDAALAEAAAQGSPLEQILMARGVSSKTLDELLKIRARHGYPCEGCKAVTFMLPGESRQTKGCEVCGDRLGNEPAPPPPALVPPPPPAAPEPPGTPALERPRGQNQGIVHTASGRISGAAPTSGFAPTASGRTSGAAPTSGFTPTASGRLSGASPTSARFARAESSSALPAEADARSSAAAAPTRAAPTFAPPVQAKAADRPYEKATFEVPGWIWALVFLGVLWGGNQLLDYSPSHVEAAGEPEKKWTLPSAELTGELEPWPLRPGKAVLHLSEVSPAPVPRGPMSYRLTAGKLAPGAWHELVPVTSVEGPSSEGGFAEWTGELAIPHGKVKLEVRAPSGTAAGFAPLEWDLESSEAAHGHMHVPYLARVLVVLLLALYVGGPLATRLSLKHAARPRASLVDGGTIPPAIGGFLQTRALEIERLGFERVPSFELDLGPGGMAYVCRLLNRTTGDMAHATVLCARSGAVKLKYTGFVSRFASGAIAETSNSPTFSDVIPRPPYVRIRQVREDSLERLYKIHQGLANETEKGSKKVLPDPGKEGEQLARSAVESLELAAKVGYFQLSRDGALYRPTLKGAFLMTWRLLPPWKQLGLARRDREEKRLRAAYGA